MSIDPTTAINLFRTRTTRDNSRCINAAAHIYATAHIQPLDVSGCVNVCSTNTCVYTPIAIQLKEYVPEAVKDCGFVNARVKYVVVIVCASVIRKFI